MKNSKKICSFVLVLMICFSIYSLNLNVLAKNNSNITYITNANITNFYNKNIKTVNKDEVKSLENSESKYIIVDENMLDDIYIKVTLNNCFENNKKIFVMSRNLSRNEIRQYFGLEQKEYPENKEVVQSQDYSSDNMVNVSNFDSIGMLIYRDELGINITNVKIEKSDDEESIYNAIEEVFNYNYLKLSLNIETKKDTLFTTNIVSANYTSSWTNVDLDTWTYITTRCKIDTSLKIDKNDGNPNDDDEYLYYVPYVAEVEMYTVWLIDELDIETKGKAGSLVYEYGPKATSSVTSVSFSLPFSFNVNFTIGNKVNITKISGGIDSNNTKLNYDIRGIFGIDSIGTALSATTHIESYQTSSFLEGYGQFYVRTVGKDFIQPITYCNTAWDSISGS